MSGKTSLIIKLILLPILLSGGLGCGKFFGSTASGNKAKPGNYIYEMPPETPTQSEMPKVKKADFTMTAEELVKEFMREGAASEDLKRKYAGKNIAVSGRVKMFSFQENGTAAPYVVLAALESERGVICNVADTKNTAKHIAKDKFVTMQGLMDQFPSAGTSPSLVGCVVLKAD